ARPEVAERLARDRLRLPSRSHALSTPLGDVEHERRVEPERPAREMRPRRATGEAGPARDRPRRDAPDRFELVPRVPPRAAERVEELEVGVRAALQLVLGELLQEPEPPRELAVGPGEARGRGRDLAECNAPAELALELGPALRGLVGVQPIGVERRRDDVGLGAREHPRPELVVLALAVRLVVAQPVPLEMGALE